MNTAQTSDGLPLAGIRVVELTNALAGPSCTALLADWGADVIRVESPNHWQPGARGLMARPSPELVKAQKNWTMCYPDWEPGDRPYERSAIFANSCRGKRSVAVDISQPQGLAAFLKLIELADVFVENNAPEVPAKLGIEYDTLAACNPRLVMLQMPAYGHTGPHKSFRSFGNQVEAVVGHAAIRGYSDSGPKELEATFASDVGAGVFGAFAVTIALTERLRTGKGQRIELALSEMFLSWLVEPLLLLQLEGVEMRPNANRDRQHAPYGCYPTAGEDKWINICVQSDEQWQSLVEIIDDDALRAPEYSGEDGRRAAHDVIDARIATWARQFDKGGLASILQEAGIPAAPVLDALEMLQDRHLQARGAFQALDHQATGVQMYPGPPFREDGEPPRLRSGPPLLGEHNEEVLCGLARLSRDEYEELIRLGIVGTEFRADIP